MQKHNTFDVFTPTSPARLSFVEREGVNSRLVDALRTPGMQVVVYGHSGSGKSTLLLNKLQQLYEKHLISRCMRGLKFDQLVLDAFDQLSCFYSSEYSLSKSRTVKEKVSTEYMAIKAQIEASATAEQSVKKARILPPQLTPQTLARFMGEANTCWVLEDFHKLDHVERANLSQVMKVFMDMADEYRNLKIVAIGAVDTARQIVEYDPEMKNRVAEIHVPLMIQEELIRIIDKGSSLLNLEFNNELKSGVGEFSNGMASVCHQICLNVCMSEEIYTTLDDEVIVDSEHLNTAIKMYLEQCSDTIKKSFDAAFKQKRPKRFDNARLILKALTEFSQEGGTRSEIYSKITRTVSDYPQGNMTTFINRLSSEGESAILRYDDVSGRYSFKDPIYRAFALAYFKNNQKQNGEISIRDLDAYLENLKFDIGIGGLSKITINLGKNHLIKRIRR